MNSTAHGAYAVPVFALAALVLLLFAAGCTGKPAAEPAATPATTVPTPVPTPVMTAVPTATQESPDAMADREFAAAADACYEKTPVIANLTTHLEFATCMKNTPLPPGNCAQNYRYYVLKATNADPTTAGFAREMTTAGLAREAFRRGEGYDGTRLEYVPCGGNATLIKTSFYQ